MFNYIILSDDFLVIGVVTLSEMVSDDKMVLVDSVDMTMLLKRYNRETGEFE